ncbi:MAG: twin-arginine translocation signal domain-containing protein [Pirellulaceae bacterium]
MKEPRNPKRGIHRRDLIKGTAAAGLAFTVGVGGEPQAAAPADDNPIRKENAKPGTRDWLLTKTDVSNNEPVGSKNSDELKVPRFTRLNVRRISPSQPLDFNCRRRKLADFRR